MPRKPFVAPAFDEPGDSAGVVELVMYAPSAGIDPGTINAELERRTQTIRKPSLLCECGKPVLACLCQICCDPTGAAHGKPERTRALEKDVCAVCASRMLGTQRAA